METRVIQPPTDRPITEEDRTQSIQMRSWTQLITNQALIIGTGSPEGVIEAVQGSSYMDEGGALGNILYLKQKDADVSGDKSNEWKLIG